MARVVVAMSGGVDSSLAAALMVEAGHDVEGVTMRLHAPGSGAGKGTYDAIRSADRVAHLLGIPHQTLDLHELFSEHVVDPFCAAYAKGITPNPCVACNEHIKFGALLAWARERSAGSLATGHYARIRTGDDGLPWLERGADNAKDQSYFLYRLDTSMLAGAVFPLGALTKRAVRSTAGLLGLPVADRRESQEACFVTGGGREELLAAEHPSALRSGPIVNLQGRVLGTHHGIAHYTVGQRRGLGIPGRQATYVVAIHAAEREIVVGTAADLERRRVLATDVVWRGAPVEPTVEVQVRHKGKAQRARAFLLEGRLAIEFDEPVIAAAPGQALVCYRGNVVLGGGTIVEER
ncbi:MAG: tRNA 2-thiouridine(34) synthase MnmA [Coriobacteriia bacterium]